MYFCRLFVRERRPHTMRSRQHCRACSAAGCKTTRYASGQRLCRRDTANCIAGTIRRKQRIIRLVVRPTTRPSPFHLLTRPTDRLSTGWRRTVSIHSAIDRTAILDEARYSKKNIFTVQLSQNELHVNS